MGTTTKIIPHWENEESYLFLNPALPAGEKEDLEKAYKKYNTLKGHIWMTSSGTSNDKKLVALSKAAFLASAAAVNLHVSANSKDVWGAALPTFHVGGLGVYARAFLLKNEIVDLLDKNNKWHVDLFYRKVKEDHVTLASLVPTQVYDLITKNYTAPPFMKAIIVGGASLNKDLYIKARHLGWPLLTSYGMTESCSQIATADLSTGKSTTIEFPKLKLLSHVEAAADEKNLLKIKGSSLLTGMCVKNQSNEYDFIDPKDSDGWYVTEDLVELENGYIIPKGRVGDFVKINGEGVSLLRLQNILESTAFDLYSEGALSFALCSQDDERSGAKLILVCEKNLATEINIDRLMKEFNQKVLPVERLKEFQTIDKIPRTDLGKINRKALLNQLTK